jgi:hypothetical protein
MTSEHHDDISASIKRSLRLDPDTLVILSSVDYWLRSQRAADKVRELLHVPTVRPDSHEATAVNALEDELRGILDALTRRSGSEYDADSRGDR